MSAEVLRHAAFTLNGREGNPAGIVLEHTTLQPLSAHDELERS